MKSLFTTILSIIIMSATIWATTSVTATAQTLLIPGKKSFKKQWLKNEAYQMTWYTVRDTVKNQIGTVSNQTLIDKGFITLITSVNLKNMKAPWVDSTIADVITLRPVYHASYNMQRDMVLNFGHIVTGYYNDKIKKQNTLISDTTTNDYFDSNLYPSLIRWLPLKDGYKKDLSIYDYNPSGKIGVIKASVLDVKSGIYQSNFSGPKNVWIVTVADEIGSSKKEPMIYYIDKADRRLWKQEINASGRKMIMQLIEQ